MFKGTYKNKEMFKKWLLLLPKINESSDKIDSLICPYCGKKEIDYLYIGYKKDMIGYVQVWCNACKHGVYISRIIIPENAKMIEMDDKTVDFNSLVPDYVQVVPE